jgi:hypothetical protein
LLSADTQSASNASKEVGKLQLALADYVHLDLIKTCVTLQKEFPLKKSHDLPALEVC